MIFISTKYKKIWVVVGTDNIPIFLTKTFKYPCFMDSKLYIDKMDMRNFNTGHGHKILNFILPFRFYYC